MTYFEAFESIKKKLENAKTDSLKEDFAIQVNLTDDDCSGAFYIELKDGSLNVEPYDYIDRNAMVSSSLADLEKSIDKKAIADGVAVEGDVAIVEALLKSVKKAAAKKPAAKKTTAAKKPAAKKTTAAKKPAAKKTTAAKKPASKAAAKVAEIKADVKKAEAKVEAKVEEKKAEIKAKTEAKKAETKTTAKKSTK